MIDENQQKALEMFTHEIEKPGPYKWPHRTPEPDAHRRWRTILNVLSKFELHSATGLKNEMTPSERAAHESVHRYLASECEAARDEWLRGSLC